MRFPSPTISLDFDFLSNNNLIKCPDSSDGAEGYVIPLYKCGTEAIVREDHLFSKACNITPMYDILILLFVSV